MQFNNMLKNSFAIVCEWPGTTAAENEVMHRIKRSAASINKNALIIDKYGYILDENLESTDIILQNRDVDFVINLHFASPKCYDSFSYVALWNPIKFYHDWGYQKYSFNLVTHHDFISCSSDPADDHALRIAHANNTKHLTPEIVINHTNSGPYYPFSDNRSGIFYCGTNWDKIVGNKTSRFADIFTILDEKDILKIYGPKKLANGVVPWEGFKSYVDEIPYDGISTFKEISKCLLGLALSHESHIESEIASSRVFELIAGGALPICDENPFFKKVFGQKVLYVDGKGENKAYQIINHYNWALQNRDKVKQMVDALQDLMQEKLDLTKQLEALYKNHQKRKEVVEKQYCALGTKFLVNVIYLHNSQSEKKHSDNFSNLTSSLKSQNYQNINLIIASNDATLKSIKSLDDLGIKYIIIAHNMSVYGKTGLILEKIQNQLPKQENQLFLVINRYERFFYDHISSLVRYFEDQDNCQAAISNVVLVNQAIKYGPFVNNLKDYYVTDHNISTGDIMFRTMPPAFILRYLDPVNYYQSLKAFFANCHYQTNKTTIAIDIKNDLRDFKQDCLNGSLRLEYALESHQPPSYISTISKDEAYQLLSKIKILRPIVKIRDILVKRNIARRKKKLEAKIE